MAALTAFVLIPAPADRAQVLTLIEDNFQTLEVPQPTDALDIAFHGLINKRQFAIHCGLEYEERFEDMDFAQLCAAFQTTPTDEIRIVAAHDTPDDQRLLARLALLFADPFHGIVALPGNAIDTPNEIPTTLPGRFVALRAFDAGEPISEDRTCYFADAEFLKHWLQDPAFNMTAT